MEKPVLIVDDEENIRSGVTYVVKRDVYAVLSAVNGLGTLQIASKQKSDVLLLNRMLSQIAGLEVFRQLRLETAVPIIVGTARDSQLDTVVGLDVGADDDVTKPFNSSVLSEYETER